MADYYPLLSRAVAGLPQSTPESRRAIYDRASKALLGQLQSLQPPVPQSDIDREAKALEDAIARIEAEHAPPSAEAAATAAIEAALAGFQSAPKAPAIPAPAIPAPSVSAPSVSAPSASAPSVSAPAVSAPAAPKSSAAAPPVVAPAVSGTPASMAPAGGTAPVHPAVPIAPPKPAAPVAPQRPVAPKSAVATPMAAPSGDAPEFSGSGRVEGAGNPANELETPIRPAGPIVSPAAPRPSRPGIGSGQMAASGGKKKPVLVYAVVGLLFACIAGGVGYLALKNKMSPDQMRQARTGSPAAPAPAAVTDTPAPPPGGAAPASNAPKTETRAAGGANAPEQPSPPVQPAEPGQQEPPARSAQAEPPRATAPGGPAAAPETPAQPGVPVAQRSAILIGAPTRENPNNVQTYVGTAVWRAENVSRGPGQPLSYAVRADIDIPEAKFSAVMTIEKNLDTTFPASHTVTWRFQRSDDSPIPEIAETDNLQMRDETSPSVDPLVGARARITSNIFIIALAAGDAASKRNIDLIEKKGWFDLPVRTSDNRLAKITLEKGSPGEKIMAEALQRWAQ